MSNSLGPVDFPVGLVDYIHNFLNEQWVYLNILVSRCSKDTEKPFGQAHKGFNLLKGKPKLENPFPFHPVALTWTEPHHITQMLLQYVSVIYNIQRVVQERRVHIPVVMKVGPVEVFWAPQ